MTLIQFPLVTFIEEIRNSFVDTKHNQGKVRVPLNSPVGLQHRH